MHYLPQLRLDQWLTFVVMCVAIVLYPSFDSSAALQEISAQKQNVGLIELVPIPVRTSGSELGMIVGEPIITASSAAVIDVHSGALLYSKNAHDVYLPASTTKLMTALIARDIYALDTILTVTGNERIEDGAKIGFYQNEQLTVLDLLKAILIQSGNDAALVLAEHHPEGTAGFVRDMNKKAAELHLSKTIFENPTGFDGVHHQTTAYDLALITKKVLQDPVLSEIVATPSAVINDVTGQYTHRLRTTHELLLSDPTVKGVKTGTTEGARQVLITAVERNGRTIIVVLMGSSDRYVDTRLLIEWAFSQYTWVDPGEALVPKLGDLKESDILNSYNLMHITVIGTGFVGVVSAAVYSSFGHDVMGLDIDEKKVESLKQSRVPFYEPDLESLLAEQQKLGRLEFTTDYQAAIKNADVIIIAVGTPSAPDGGADLTYVFKSCESLAPHLKPDAIIAIKSTVPPGTLPKVKAHIQQFTQTPFYMASLPEFLREGTAVYDTLHPDRVVIGATEAEAFARLEELHQPLQAPIIRVSPESAQMAKYAANAYLATRITFINQIADLCAKNGADIQQVIEAVGFDQRIGQHYWYPGFGYGGSCFPKDVKELAYYSKTVGEEGNLLIRVDELNELRIPKLMGEFGVKMSGWQGKTVAVLGLSFKPHTDDMREAPSTKVIPWLLEQGAVVRGFDPKALEVAPHFIAEHSSLSYYQTIPEATQGADVILVLIEWPEIITFDYGSVREPSKQQWLVDARNQFSPAKAVEWGYQYLGVGR